ncbi:thiamine phosphate synthase [Caryophanon latum]|uniref:Thiamine-phosphate synthase n=1 Tax=Caryophanon latum TaxID=33977 RepID=A0A1C0YZW0_9BACL|nr:thiamine phosphate synthase [Caryophanon latum]OCS92673.1 thiamine-phosphate diphosphorylase [Caryophanon latum]
MYMCCNVKTYFIMGSVNCVRDPLVVLEEALAAGITMFQLREKGDGAKTGEQYVAFAKACQHLCARYAVPFIVNDDVALAVALDADGVHVGQDDASIQAYRRAHPQKIVGVSVHNVAEFERAIDDGANYVGIGPIFETTSKLDAKPPSIAFLREARRAYPNFPIVAIGGITTENCSVVRAAGADGVAVIRDIAMNENVAQTVEKFNMSSIG